MEIGNDRLYAVLTGDLVKSSRYAVEEKQAALQALRESTILLGDLYSSMEVVGLEAFRGDGWQLLISRPEEVLYAAFFLRASLKKQHLPDTAIAIGIGTVTHLPNNQLAEASGTAFELSGRALDSTKKRMVLKIDADQTKTVLIDEPLLNASLLLASRLADQWSAGDARAVWGAIQGMKQVDIGKLWPETIKQQSVQGALYRAGWTEIDALCSEFKQWCASAQALEPVIRKTGFRACN